MEKVTQSLPSQVYASASNAKYARGPFGFLKPSIGYSDLGRFDRQADLRQAQDTSYTPMFISGGMQRDMGVQGAIGRPMGGYNMYGMGIQGFGAPSPVGYGFNGYGGGVQGRMAMPTEQQGPWSGFSGMTNYGQRPDGFIERTATNSWGPTGWGRSGLFRRMRPNAWGWNPI